jgi:cytochrome oxidase Cu insertion factor (SCO1/SenC/PrrC family)
MKWLPVILLLTLPVLVASQPPHHEAAGKAQVLAPGYSALNFPAPEAGSYQLPPLGNAANGELLDSAGTPVTLHALYADKIIILSFIYTSCNDVNGCPLASFVLGQVQRRLSVDDELNSRVRLVTVSFDPANDSPQIMSNYAKGFRRGDVDWSFLTADSEESLAPVLDDYDQSVIRDRDPEGKLLGSMSHILRVFLIDPQMKIRNIYSPSFLHPDILLADIRTVLVD